MLHRHRLHWLPILLLLLGASLRLWFIGVHGLDADELFTVNFLRGPASLILSTFSNTVIEVDPKLFYLTMFLWPRMAGVSELALRLPNVLFDLLLGVLLIQSGRTKFDGRTAVIVGLLWALNPLLIWVTGMVNKYALLGLLTEITWISALRAASGGDRRWWVLFTLAALAAAYEHVLGLVVVAGAGAIIVILAVLRRQIAGLITLAIVGLAYLPYLFNLWAQFSVTRRLGAALPANPLDFGLRFFAALAGNLPPLPAPALWALAATCLIVIGAGVWRSPKPRVWIISLTALLAIYALASGYLALRQSIFESRYVAYSAPLFLLVISAVISRMPSRWLQAGLVIALGGLSIYGLNAQSLPATHDDFRSATLFLESHADSDDLIIAMGDYALPPLQYYYQGGTKIIAPWHDVVQGGFKQKLEQTIQGYDSVWIVLYQTNVVDPKNRFDSYFRARYPIRTEVFPTGVTVRGYDLRPMTASLPTEAMLYNATFNGQIALRGFQTYEGQLSAHDNRLHPPSGWVHVTLYWESLKLGADFRPAVQVEDRLGQVWGIALTRPNDVFALHPPAGWQPGQIWRSDTDINLNPVTPPGVYNVILRVGPPGEGQTWADDHGDSAIVIAQVTIIP